MGDYFLVRRVRGPAWNHAHALRQQDGWDEHAAFMDALAETGVIVLGGPVGAGDGDHFLLVIDLESEASVRARLAHDPWADDMLTIEAVQPWQVWLRVGEQ